MGQTAALVVAHWTFGNATGFSIMRFPGGFAIVFVGLVKNCLVEVVVIGKPEFSCGPNWEVVELKSDITKISLPKNTPIVWFSVNAQRSSKCTHHGTCGLITWKVLRDFEKYLSINFNNTGIHGVIYFKNHMLVSGFNYLLHVTLRNSDGKIEERGFNITFFDHDIVQDTMKVYGVLDLEIGTDRIRWNSPLILNADVSLCGNVEHYYFDWSIVTADQETTIPERSSRLFIPPSSQLLKNEDWCVIKCRVMNFDNNTSILEESKKISINKVPDEEPQVFLPFRHSTYALAAPISVLPYIYPEILDFQAEWTCNFEGTVLRSCQGQSHTEFYLETGFSEEGNYSLTFTVKTTTTEKTATCNITVRLEVPSINIGLVYPIRPEKGVEINAKISELRTYCWVKWVADPIINRFGDKVPLSEIYNISATDKSFLEELVELGGTTATKHLTFKIPPPSRTWGGLEPGDYVVGLVVTCPSLQEINDKSEIKDRPTDFVTISAETSFVVPPSPIAGSLDVTFDDDEALSSQFRYVVRKGQEDIGSGLIYTYGYLLDGVELVVYRGVDVFSTKTVLPFNGDTGVETYVEICDCRTRCAKTFGPIVTPRMNNNLDQIKILKEFRQKLIEEDFYAAFSFAFIVLHSEKFLNQTQTFSNLFSSELSLELSELVEKSDRLPFNNFIKNFATFANYLKVSDELMKHLSQLTPAHPHLSRRILGLSENLDGLEEIQYYMIISEYSVLNGEAVEREEDRLINLLEQWMTQACTKLNRGQQVAKVEMKTMIFTIEKVSGSTLNKLKTVHFDDNLWNFTTHLKISDISSGAGLCLGYVLLKNLFSQKGVSFGANLYGGNEQSNISPNVTIFLPKPKEFDWLQCSVYKNGWTLDCPSPKQHSDFVECFCPSFGYYLVNSRNGSSLVEENWTISNNSANSSFPNDDYDNFLNENARRIGYQIFYVIIASSLGGFCILCYIIKKLTIFPQHNMVLDGFSDNYHYGQVMNEDLTA